VFHRVAFFLLRVCRKPAEKLPTFGVQEYTHLCNILINLSLTVEFGAPQPIADHAEYSSLGPAAKFEGQGSVVKVTV